MHSIDVPLSKLCCLELEQGFKNCYLTSCKSTI